MVPFQMWVGTEEGVGLPQGVGPNKSVEREVERRKESVVRIGCAVGGCRLTPDLPLPLHLLPLVRRVLHVHVCVCTDTGERERQSHQAS